MDTDHEKSVQKKNEYPKTKTPADAGVFDEDFILLRAIPDVLLQTQKVWSAPALSARVVQAVGSTQVQTSSPGHFHARKFPGSPHRERKGYSLHH
jgi:hypothetical protein